MTPDTAVLTIYKIHSFLNKLEEKKKKIFQTNKHVFNFVCKFQKCMCAAQLTMQHCNQLHCVQHKKRILDLLKVLKQLANIMQKNSVCILTKISVLLFYLLFCSYSL